MTPALFYAPHRSRQEKVLKCMRRPQDTKTSTSHHRSHQHRKRPTTQYMEGPGFKRHLIHQAPKRDTQKLTRVCLLYAPPCASKNHPQGQNGASHSPYEPACGHVHCVEGKRRFFFNRGNHTLISVSYKIISPGNALKVS